MFSRPKQNKKDLAKALEIQASQLEKFMKLPMDDFPSTELRDLLEAREIEDLKQILNGVISGAKSLEPLLDEGIQSLEGYGMQFNNKTNKMENIFAQYPTDKVPDGVSIVDESKFDPKENFGVVLKKAFGLDWRKTPDQTKDGRVVRGRSGMSRTQADCDMVQEYEKSMKKGQGIREVEAGFLTDLIGLRTNHNAILAPAYDILDSLAILAQVTQSEATKMIAGNQLASVIASLREAAKVVRKINDYSDLMPAKEFQSVTSILGVIRPTIFKQIDCELRILQEPPSTWAFWKKQIPLSSDQRSAHLETLKSFVEDALQNEDVDKRRKSGLKRLLPQIDYAMQKVLTVQMQEKKLRRDKLAPLKETLPNRKSA